MEDTPHPTPGARSTPSRQAWQQAGGRHGWGAHHGIGHSDYSPGCLVRRGLRMQTAASPSSASQVLTILGKGKPLRSGRAVYPWAESLTACSPEAQSTKETLGPLHSQSLEGERSPEPMPSEALSLSHRRHPGHRGPGRAGTGLPCALDTLCLQDPDPQACPGLAHACNTLLSLELSGWCWAENARLSEEQSPSQGQP